MAERKQTLAQQRNYAVEILTDVILPVEVSRSTGEKTTLRRISHCRWLPGFTFIEADFKPVFMGLVLHGKGIQYDADGLAHPLAPGTLMVCGGKGLRAHCVTDPAGLEVLFIVTQAHESEVFALSKFTGLPLALPTPRAAECEELLRIMLREGKRMERDTVPICNRLGEALLMLAAEAWMQQQQQLSRREALFLQARRHIQESLQQPINAGSVASSIGISRAYLARIFAEFAQESPLQYIQRQRMLMAAELLQERTDTVQQIAWSMGFTDPLQFSRTFRRVMGTAPGKMRRTTASST